MNPLKLDTLEYQTARPGCLHRDMSKVPLKTVIKTMKSNKAQKQHPEVDGLRFYLGNHAVAIMRQRYLPKEPLGAAKVVMDLYHNMLATTVPRMFHYLLKICTREMRHTKTNGSNNLEGYIKGEYVKSGDVFWKFYKSIKGSGSNDAVEKLLSSPPDMSLGEYVDALYDMFYKGVFGGGYGGPAWGEVTHCLREFVHGRYTAEMMMDTAFTLCHNNGPIFNKGMEFHHYDSGTILRILDVQRSGQIPQLIAEKGGSYTDDHIIQAEYEGYRAIIGQAFEGHVDWYVVEALGSMGHYPAEKQQQVAKYGASKAAEKAEKVKAQKLAEAEKKAAEALAKQEKRYYMVAPGLKVKKILRETV